MSCTVLQKVVWGPPAPLHIVFSFTVIPDFPSTLCFQLTWPPGTPPKFPNQELKSGFPEKEGQISHQYSDVIKTAKKSNITKDNIGEIMLSQIPGISITVAKSLMVSFKTIKNLTIDGIPCSAWEHILSVNWNFLLMQKLFEKKVDFHAIIKCC